MRIAYVCATSAVSGGVRILAEHLNRLGDRGHFCCYLTLTPSPLDWLPTSFGQGTLDQPPAPLDSFDVVVGTAISTWKVVAEDERFGKAKRMSLVQMLDHLWFPEGSPQYAEYKLYYQLTLEPITISAWLKEEMLKYHPVVHLVPNGIDPRLFYPDPFPGEERKRRWPPRILVEGWTHSAVKDQAEMAFFAIDALRSEGLEFEVWGFSQYAPRWEFDRFWRLPEQDDIRRIYSSADILMKASRFEGRPGPDLEAMACGCVVNRAIEKGDDDLLDRNNCLKVAYGDQATYNANTLKLFSDPDLAEVLRQRAFEYVRQTKNWDVILPQLEAALAA